MPRKGRTSQEEEEPAVITAQTEEKQEDNGPVMIQMMKMMENMMNMMNTMTITMQSLTKNQSISITGSVNSNTISKHNTIDPHINANNTNAIINSPTTANHNNNNTINDSTATIIRHKKKIPQFDGNKNNIAVYKSWKARLKQYLIYYNVQSNDIHSVLCDCLTDNALLWFMSYTEAHEEIKTYNYDKLITVLDREYLNPLLVSKYLIDYEQMKPMSENETVKELDTRINNLATQAGKALRTDEEKKLKLFALLPLSLQQTQISTVYNERITYEELLTYVIHTKEIIDATSHRRVIKESHNIATCDYSKKPNHSTTYCSSLLTALHLKKPDAIKFWEINRLEEKLKSAHTDNG